MRFGLIDDNGDDDLGQLDETWIAHKQPTNEHSQPSSSLNFASSQPRPIPKGNSALTSSTNALSPSTGYSDLSTHWHSPHSYNSFRCPSSEEEEDSSDDELLTGLPVLAHKQPGTPSLSTSLVSATSPNARLRSDESPHTRLSYERASLPTEQFHMSPLAARMRSASPAATPSKSLQWSQDDMEGNNVVRTPLSRSAPRLRTPQARHRTDASITLKDEPEAVLMKYVNYVDAQEIIIKEAKRAGKVAAADKAIQVRQEKSRIREESIRNQEQYMQQIYQATEEATKALERLLLTRLVR
ncbi:hypothetical protein BDF22DRAFT_2169 [Syncephalis plumigaleata]|nr:hypothetical protein BDF22DRAFT_2169 [Syncephalis plumigaleata]